MPVDLSDLIENFRDKRRFLVYILPSPHARSFPLYTQVLGSGLPWLAGIKIGVRGNGVAFQPISALSHMIASSHTRLLKFKF